MIVERQLQLVALRLVCSLSVAAGASEDLLSLVDSGVHEGG